MDARIEAVCRTIEARVDEPLPLSELGVVAGLSPEHLQRSFKAAVGVSPRQFQEALRLGLLRRELRSAESVTDAIFRAGYRSVSRVYERSDQRLGMTPSTYRREGEGVLIEHAAIQTPLGLLLIGATERGLCSIQLGSSHTALLAELAKEFPRADLVPARIDDSELTIWAVLIWHYLAGAQLRLDRLPLDIQGTAFQAAIWHELLAIPYGETRTYAELARAVGRPTAARAIARACATNRIAVVVPCHRVIRGDGSLAGYRWGVERKQGLLDLERGDGAQVGLFG